MEAPGNDNVDNRGRRRKIFERIIRTAELTENITIITRRYNSFARANCIHTYYTH